MRFSVYIFRLLLHLLQYLHPFLQSTDVQPRHLIQLLLPFPLLPFLLLYGLHSPLPFLHNLHSIVEVPLYQFNVIFRFVKFMILLNKLLVVDFIIHFGESSLWHGKKEVDKIFRRAVIAISSLDHFLMNYIPLVVIFFHKFKQICNLL